MPITRHQLRNVADLPRILDLVRSMPDVSRHIVDLPWRLGALDLDQGCDAVFWEDTHGKMVGFQQVHIIGSSQKRLNQTV